MRMEIVRIGDYGVTSGQEYDVDIVPRVGESVVLPDDRGGDHFCVVTKVRHVVAENRVEVFVR